MNLLSRFQNHPLVKNREIASAVLWSILYAYIAGYILKNFSSSSGASMIWVPAGIGLAMLLNYGNRFWPFIFVAAIVGEVLGGFDLFISFQLAASSTLAAVIGSLLLQHVFSFNKDITSILDIASLFVVSVITALVASSLSTLLLMHAGLSENDTYLNIFYTWFVGDFFGAAFFTPVILVWRTAPKDWFKTPRLYEVLVFFGLVFLFGQAVIFGWLHNEFAQLEFLNRGYFVYPILLVAALRYGRHGAMLILAMTVLQSILGAYEGHGFFNKNLMNDPAPISIWAYLSLMCLVGLLVSLIIESIEGKTNDLLQVEGRFRAIIERMPVSMALLDMQKRSVEFVNKAYTDLTGYQAEDLQNSDKWWDLVYPDPQYRKEIQREWNDRLHQARQTQSAMAPLESWTTCKNGSRKYISWGSVQAGDKFAIYGIDLTERKHDEDLLRITSSVYQAIGEAVFIMDGKNNIVVVNDVFQEITGYTEAEIVGKELPSILVKAHGARSYSDLIPSLDSVGHWEGQVWMKRKADTEYLGFLSIFTALDDTGSVRQRVGMVSPVSDQKRTREIINRQANYDALTGLPNRRLFLDRVDESIKRADRAKNTFALLFVDLDHFKDINDTSGHDVGDEILRRVSDRFKEEVRESDTVARIGGDEFTIILNDLDSPQNIDKVLLAITDRLAEPIEIEGQVFHISASLGIAFYPQDANSTKGLLMKADQAMYAVKNQGRNGFHYFTQSLQELADRKMKIISELRTALQENQFDVFYQPIVDLKTKEVIHAEALLRWRRHDGVLILPEHFIEVAEDSGLIIEMGDWVFRQVCQFLLALPKSENNISVGINVSATQFNSNKHSALNWIEYLHELNLSTERVILEITEHTMMNQNARVSQKIALLHESGFRFAIDDFGTGYSSLSALRNFNFDFLKIDSSFTAQIAQASADRALVQAMITMGSGLNLQSIAEGVETEEQRQILLDIGCQIGQGYLFGRPMSRTDFQMHLKQASQG